MRSERETNERGHTKRKERERGRDEAVCVWLRLQRRIGGLSLGGEQSVAVPAGNTANASQQMKMNALNLSAAKTTPLH